MAGGRFGLNRDEQNEQETEQIFSRFKPKVTQTEADKAEDKKQTEAQEKVEKNTGKPLTKEEKKERFEQEYERRSGEVGDWIEQHSSVLVLAGLLLFSLPLFLLFRRSPSIPDLRLSECFVAMVYITDMILIYGIIPSLLCFSVKAEIYYDLLSLLLSLLCFSVKAEIYYDLLSLLLAIIPIKQLSGYSYFSTIWRLLAAFIPFAIMCMILLIAGIIIIAFSIKLML